MMIKWYALLE